MKMVVWYFKEGGMVLLKLNFTQIYDDCPTTMGFVRAQLDYSGWMLSPVTDRPGFCQLALVIACEFPGFQPV